MKRFTLAIAAVAATAVFTTSGASASDRSAWNHGALHRNLSHNNYHRALTHNHAHRHGMTYRQHNRLHDSLDHGAYHDRLNHRRRHRANTWNRGWYGNGFGTYNRGPGFGGRGFGVYFRR